jgi:hypothetical protein
MKSTATYVLLIFVVVSIGYFVLSETKRPPAPTTSQPVAGTHAGEEEPSPAQTQPAHRVVAYYFHNTQRCTTCLKIERLAEEALREQFAPALERGALEWHTVNMEEAPNTHFVEDYGLVTSSVVLVDLEGDWQRDWTLMGKVWDLVHDDEDAFKRYIVDQARTYLGS